MSRPLAMWQYGLGRIHAAFMPHRASSVWPRLAGAWGSLRQRSDAENSLRSASWPRSEPPCYRHRSSASSTGAARACVACGAGVTRSHCTRVLSSRCRSMHPGMRLLLTILLPPALLHSLAPSLTCFTYLTRFTHLLTYSRTSLTYSPGACRRSAPWHARGAGELRRYALRRAG